MINATFDLGGGPQAGLAPLVWAARQGALRRLAAEGLVVIERGQKSAPARLGVMQLAPIRSLKPFLNVWRIARSFPLALFREHPATLAVAAYRGGSVPLPLAANFLEALGEAMSGAILSAGGRILTNCEAVRSRRRADGDWQKRHCVRPPASTTSYRATSCSPPVLNKAADPLYARPVAGEALLPRFADKLMLSGEVLAGEALLRSPSVWAE